MASQVPPKRGVAFSFELSLVSQADTDVFQSNPTLAAGDVVVYQDGALDGNIDTLPTAIGAGKILACTLSIAEMTADRVLVIFSDQAGDEWQDLIVSVHTVTTSQIDDLATSTALATAQTDLDNPAQYKADVSTLATSAALATVQADLDNPTQYKADVSTLATSAAVASLNDLSAAQVNTEMDTALSDIKLDHLVAVAESDDPVDDSIVAKLAASDGDWSGFSKGADSLEAIRDRGDAAWTTGSVAGVEAALEAIDLDHLIQVTAGSEKPTDGSYLDQIMNKDASQAFSSGTDSLEALRDYFARSVTPATTAYELTARRGDTYDSDDDSAITDLGDITGRSKLWITVKMSTDLTDAQATLFVEETDGLTVVNGAVYGTAAHSSITVTDETAGDLTWAIDEGVTDDLVPRSYEYDIQVLDSGDVTTLRTGVFTVITDVTRAIA